MESIIVSKKEAAERQLNTCIELFFREEDSVSVHTLASAVHDILEVLTRDIRWFDIMLTASCIKPEKKKEVADIFKKAQNFFKHASRDASVTMEFAPFQTEVMIFDCVRMYMCLTGQKTAEVHVYNLWFIMRYPEYFDYIRDANDPLFKLFATAEGVGVDPKHLQPFADVIPLLKKSGAFPLAIPGQPHPL
jgi:hypothetical protein